MTAVAFRSSGIYGILLDNTISILCEEPTWVVWNLSPFRIFHFSLIGTALFSCEWVAFVLVFGKARRR